MSQDMTSFQDYKIHQLVRDFWKNKETGSLHVEIQGFEKSLYFREGQLVFAVSKDPRDKLPQIFITQGRFTEEQFVAVQPNFRADLSVGRNLVEMGLITQNELVEGAKLQIFHIFSQAMSGEYGKYRAEIDSLPQGLVSLPLKFPTDFANAIAAIPSKDWFSHWLGTPNRFMIEQITGPQGEFHKKGLANFAAEVYEAIKNRIDFNHLAFEVDADDFSLIKFLYTLELLGYVEIDRLEEEPEETVEAPEEKMDRFGFGDETGELSGIDAQKLRNEFASQSRFDEQLQQFGKLSMDETVELSGFANDTSGYGFPSMDATTEISREVLRDSDPFESNETYEMKRVTEGSFARDIEIGEDSDEQMGLDDLTSDSFERHLEHLEKQRLPVDEEHVFEEGSAEEEPEEKSRISLTALVARLREVFGEKLAKLPRPKIALPESAIRRKRLFFWLLGSLCLGASAFVAATHWPVVQGFWVTSFQLAQKSASSPPADNETPPMAVKQNEERSTSEATTIESPSELKNSAITTQEPTASSLETEAEKTSNQAKTEPLIHEQQVNQLAEKSEEDEAAAAPTTQPVLGLRVPARGFHSPVADGWDSELGRPRNAALPAKVLASNRPKQTETAPADDQKSPIRAEAKPAEEPVKQPTNTAKVANANSAPDTRALLLSGQYAAAAKAESEKFASDKSQFAAVLFSSCSPEKVKSGLTEPGALENLYLLPKKGSPGCFWVCWGKPGSRMSSLSNLTKAPKKLRELAQDEVSQAKSLAELL